MINAVTGFVPVIEANCIIPHRWQSRIPTVPARTAAHRSFFDHFFISDIPHERARSINPHINPPVGDMNF